MVILNFPILQLATAHTLGRYPAVFDWAVRKQPFAFAHGKERLKTLDFDVHNYSYETLIDLVLEVFVEVTQHPCTRLLIYLALTTACAQLELDIRLRLKHRALRSLIVSVRYRMLDNPYHNFYHSVDMMQVSIPCTADVF